MAHVCQVYTGGFSEATAAGRQMVVHVFAVWKRLGASVRNLQNPVLLHHHIAKRVPPLRTAVPPCGRGVSIQIVRQKGNS